jgi:BirA family transcriptional regulator, biotin operon repressor / biotin---[acetyl-CoA-carboxylase] ligase
MLNTDGGLKIVLLPAVDSTNNYAAKALSEGKLTHGTVILAEKQTAGRGQRGSTWTSGANQFTGSFYVETAFLSARNLPLLNFAVATALRAAIADLISEDVKIKWPNDMLVNDRKIAGILVETQWSGASMKGAIVGIGLNLHKEELPSACSLEDFGAGAGIAEMALAIWSHMRESLALLRAGRYDEIATEYHSRLWRMGVEQTASLPDGRRITGRITGVDGQGDLCFETEAGTAAYGIKEIAFAY